MITHCSQGERTNSPRTIPVNPVLVQAQLANKRLFQTPRGSLLNNMCQFVGNHITRGDAWRDIAYAR